MQPRHAASAVLVAVIWGVNFVVIHVGLQSTPPLLLAALRFALVAALGAWFVPRPALPWPRLVALGLLLYVGQFGLLFTAMDRGFSAGLAAVVMQSQAVFTVILAVVLLRERPPRAQVIGVAVAAFGLGAIGVERAGLLSGGGAGAAGFVGSAGSVGSVGLEGFLLCLGAGLSWAFGNLVARTSGVTQGLGLVVWGSVVAAPPLTALAAWQVGPTHLVEAIGRIDAAGLASLVYLAVLATVVGFGTWSALMGRYPAALVAPFTMLVPPVGLVAAWLALGERPSVVEIAGSALVVAGLLYPAALARQSSVSRPSSPKTVRSAG